MFKKFRVFVIFSTLLIVLTWLMPTVLGDDVDDTIENANTIKEEIIETSTNAVKETSLPTINSRSAIVLDRNSNTVLYGKNENEQRKMASTTKIMTSIIVIENCNLTDTVEVSKKSAGTGGSRLGLKTGDKITVNDLLYGLMLCSGNDAAVALAEHVGGSIEGFAELMNNKAKELNLENTSFETPHGLDAPNHFTTAYELALLSKYALDNETFSKIVGTKNYTVTINGYPKALSNTNELLGNLNGVYGIKTGFTNGANRCLVTACKRDNLDVICVVLGADTKKFRTQDSIKLIEYVFKTYEPVNVQELVDKKFEEWQKNNLDTFDIIKGETNKISLKLEPLEYATIPIDKSLIDSLDVSITCTKVLEAPVVEGTVLGSISVYTRNTDNLNENNEIETCNILIDCNINKKNVVNYFIEFLKLYKSAIRDGLFWQ